MDESTAPTFRTEKYRFIREKLSLDLLRITDEVSEISTLIQDAGECISLAMEIKDSAKEELELIRSRVASELRKLPLTSGKDRSEARIESELPLALSFQEKLAAFRLARLDASLWATLGEALRNKAYTIRAAADLVTAGFISMDYLTNKRREEIRNAVPPVVKAAK